DGVEAGLVFREKVLTLPKQGRSGRPEPKAGAAGSNSQQRKKNGSPIEKILLFATKLRRRV
ncbi:MAG: hypothetical protein K2P00_04295, partial [Alistipes sp.]|nr:hypothetical protein [Alistipes sp.]